MRCHCEAGWICEQHPDLQWPHDDCDGPGEQWRNPECPWWAGPEPAALSTERWDRIYASTRSSGTFRVVQPWGPDKAQQSTLISEHATAADAFAEIDRLAAQMIRTGAPTDTVELIVVDPDGRIVQRPGAH